MRLLLLLPCVVVLSQYHPFPTSFFFTVTQNKQLFCAHSSNFYSDLLFLLDQ
jgi:hypothetical protein